MNARVKAFVIHLSISAAIVGMALALIFGVWYRPPFSYVQDVYGVVTTLVSVDLVLGPLLTLIVYKQGKKHLKLDLGLIGLMQVAALCYGLFVCFQWRPIYSVYNEGRFSTVNPEEYIPQENEKSPRNHPYPRYSITGPEWIGARRPVSLSDPDRYFIQFSTQSGGGLRLMPRFYVPYDAIRKEAAQAGMPVARIDFQATVSRAPQQPLHLKPHPLTAQQRAAVSNWVDGLDVPRDKVVLLPLVGQKRVGLVALEAGTGRILDTLGVPPWWDF